MISKKGELVNNLRNFKDQPGVGDFLRLLDLYVEEWKNNLVDAKGEDIFRLQGAIRNVNGILNLFKRNIEKTEFKDGAYNGEGTKIVAP